MGEQSKGTAPVQLQSTASWFITQSSWLIRYLEMWVTELFCGPQSVLKIHGSSNDTDVCDREIQDIHCNFRIVVAFLSSTFSLF